jgi:Na+-transporting methylmalonyl-CoA/oxaloacetate decarboxylase gamma subunit
MILPVSLVFVIIQLLFFLFFFLSIVNIIAKAIKRYKEIPQETKKETRQDVQKSQKQPSYASLYESVVQNTETQVDVQKAFLLFGLTPKASYTKVSERYYELVKKINEIKMDEKLRDEKLLELNKAYEILTEYYSKNY